jgi:hypothetical protein
MSKLVVCFNEDSFGKVTVHKNEMGLLLKESYLGHITYKEGKWWFILKGEEKEYGPYESPGKARKGIKNALGAEEINDYFGNGWRS